MACDLSSLKNGEYRYYGQDASAAKEGVHHARHPVVDILREFPILSFLIVRVDYENAKFIECESPDAEAAHNDARDEAGSVRKPKPAMVQWDQIGNSIAHSETNGKNWQEGSKGVHQGCYQHPAQPDSSPNN